MARTINESFRAFRSNLEITDLQAETVATRQSAVRDALEIELTVLESFLTGSYRRSTMITPLSNADIDIVVVLDSSYYARDGQATLLDRVKRVLRRTYTRTPEISRSGQAVTITFSDFKVDVVPAFNRKNGGYLIPNTQGGTWISTDPKKHTELSSTNNQASGGMLVPLEKMIKCWNCNTGWKFRSFHVEVLAWSIFDGVKITDFPSGTRYFFDKSRSLVRQKNPDPAGYGGDVGYYFNTDAKIEDAVSRLNTAYKRAVKAEEYASKGYIADAVDEWRKIFPSGFPAYT